MSGLSVPALVARTLAEILRLLEAAPKPMVIDADALNILSEEMPILERCAGPRLLTPHPGEMKRLFPAEGSRAELAARFCEKYPVTLLLKGSRTIVSERGASAQLQHHRQSGNGDRRHG